MNVIAESRPFVSTLHRSPLGSLTKSSITSSYYEAKKIGPFSSRFFTPFTKRETTSWRMPLIRLYSPLVPSWARTMFYKNKFHRGISMATKTASRNTSQNYYLEGNFKASLSQSIQKEFNKLMELISHVPVEKRTLQEINGTGGSVSIADIIAYQIGWGNRVIEWYQAGVQGKIPVMPGDGFTTWDYTGLALHFYKKYPFDSGHKQCQEFHRIVSQIIDIVEITHQNQQLDKEGVWEWCNLKSGKAWPLSKWIKVNTASPYQTASKNIKPFVNQFK